MKMKFSLKKASDWHFEKGIEIKTIEDLKKLSKEYGKEVLIIDFYDFSNKRITIYDDFIE